MGQVVNLRRARKARDRALRGMAAETNRVQHGRTKQAALTDALDTVRRERLLDAARRED